jgi:hypothetical protein
MIYLRDFRAPSHFTSRLEGHKQEVCGLKWSFDNASLASGGNDNKVPRARTSAHSRARAAWEAAVPLTPGRAVVMVLVGGGGCACALRNELACGGLWARRAVPGVAMRLSGGESLLCFYPPPAHEGVYA